jgi:hypothetical protein
VSSPKAWKPLISWPGLRTLGCDEAQGYFLGRPGPASDIDARLLADVRAAQRHHPLGAEVTGGMRAECVLIVDDAADVRHLARAEPPKGGWSARPTIVVRPAERARRDTTAGAGLRYSLVRMVLHQNGQLTGAVDLQVTAGAHQFTVCVSDTSDVPSSDTCQRAVIVIHKASFDGAYSGRVGINGAALAFSVSRNTITVTEPGPGSGPSMPGERLPSRRMPVWV